MARGKKIISGIPASPGVVIGRIRVVDKDREKMVKLEVGEIMVAERTTPEDLMYMSRAAAFITDVGGVTAHAAIIAREMGKPAITGTSEGTTVLKDGQMVVVDGDEGTIYHWVPEEKETLSGKMARLAKEKGIQISPEFLEKMRKREE